MHPNRIAVANGDDGTVKLYDGLTYQQVGNLAGVDDANNVRRDRRTNRINLGYAAGDFAILDAETMTRTGNITKGLLMSYPENTQGAGSGDPA